MRILMIGLNHRTAPVELRERVALQGDALNTALDRMRERHPQAEVAVISTCNRTEVYLARGTHESPSADQVIDALARGVAEDAARIRAALVHREGEEAVLHLFRVCAGLDSMVLGEPQVLGQAKRAYEIAQKRCTVGPVLHRVFQDAIGVAKRVRTETGIDSGRGSVGSVAVDFARQIFQDFSDKTVVGIGAGELAKLTLTHLAGLKPAKLWITNRTVGKAETLAKRLNIGPAGGGVRSFEDLDALLVEADVVLTATGADRPIITAGRFKPLLRKRRSRPLFIIDVALPRDVEPEVGSLANIYLYNLDDLQRAIAQTQHNRTEESQRCEGQLREAARSCLALVQNRDVGILVKALRQKLHDLGKTEQERTLRKLAASPRDVESLLEEHTHRVINKILHLPLSQMDQRKSDSPLAFYAAALRRLFDLHEAEANLARDIASQTNYPEASPTAESADAGKTSTSTPPAELPAIHAEKNG